METIEKSPISGRKIAIYGAGYDGREALRKLEALKIPVAFCVARDSQGEKLCAKSYEVEVRSPQELNRERHFVLVASSHYYPEMEKFLCDRGYETGRDYYVWQLWDMKKNDEILKYMIACSPLTEEELAKVYYRSCDFLRNNLDIFATIDDGFHLRFCCRGNGFNAHCKIPDIKYEGNVATAIDALLYEKMRLQDMFCQGQIDSESSCVGCKKMFYDVWDDITPDFRYATIGLYPTPCNFKCFYCTIPSHEKTTAKDAAHYSLAIEILKEIRERGLLSPYADIALSSGEITVSPYRNMIFDAVKDYPIAFITNASVYSEFVAQKLRKGDSSIVVSMDAGTRETFAKIKGVDAWDKTVSNLERYAQTGKVIVKFILLNGINNREREYDGIIALCKHLGLKKLSIAVDLNLNGGIFDQSSAPGEAYHIEELVQLIRKIRSAGLMECDLFNSLPQTLYDKVYSEINQQ